MNEEAKKKIEEMIHGNDIFLFMKGEPEEPKCGFSAQVVFILKQLGVEFNSFDILSDDDLRETLKKYANWPTFPQLWVHGKLIGGCDIITEMAQSGELEDLLKA